MANGKLVVIDGFSLAFRAFYALPDSMRTSSGQYTNAIYGFLSMLVTLMEKEQPTHLAVAFDHPAPTFRDHLSPQYKGTRKETPDPLKSQLSLIGEMMRTLQIPVVESPGFEADDVIATICNRAKSAEITTIVVTGDRDSFQLVTDPYVTVLYPRRGVSDYELLDEHGVERRTGVTPRLYSQYAALRGDPSDNIPGVPGIGEKTAARLINEYGSLEGIMSNVDMLTPKLGASLSAHADQLQLSLQLIPLVDDVPIDYQLDDLRLGLWNPTEARDLFQFLQLNTLWTRMQRAFGYRGTDGPASSPKPPDIELTQSTAGSLEDLRSFLDMRSEEVRLYLSVTWEGTPGRSGLRSLSLAFYDSNSKIRYLVLDSKSLFQLGAANAFGEIRSSGARISGIGLKEILRAGHIHGQTWFEADMDAAIAGYLINPAAADYDLEFLASTWLEAYHPIAQGDSPAKSTQLTMDLGQSGEGAVDPNEIATGLQVTQAAADALRQESLYELYEKIERPLIDVLAKMEAVGIAVDSNYLSSLQREFSREASVLQGEIQDLAGTAFNVNSTQQLGKVLFSDLGLATGKRTKTGYSTDVRTLEKLVGAHPIIEKVLRYREVEKLRSTYGASLISEIGPDGRIHATFTQTVARTGRLSSERPNLHNIPIRSEDGRRFRDAFVAPPGRKLVVADYSQIELRVIAHLSRDPGLIEAFANGIDIHAQTASYTFGVSLDQVTPAQRAKAKMVAYGLAYGMEAYGLSQRLNISVSEAGEILKAFFDAFPSVAEYMKSAVARARTDGYTITEFGRRRPIPELASESPRMREAAERQAMNAGIQGLAADIFKLALIKLDESLVPGEADLVLQVHDEVLVECRDGLEGRTREIVREVLESAVSLTVPLEVRVSSGSSWAGAK